MRRQRRPADVFPYTPLFRSMAGIGAPGVDAEGQGFTAGGAMSSHRPPEPGPASLEAALVNAAHDLARDRKSTRLNSSHLVISYAVFCLQKTNLPQCRKWADC